MESNGDVVSVGVASGLCSECGARVKLNYMARHKRTRKCLSRSDCMRKPKPWELESDNATTTVMEEKHKRENSSDPTESLYSSKRFKELSQDVLRRFEQYNEVQAQSSTSPFTKYRVAVAKLQKIDRMLKKFDEIDLGDIAAVTDVSVDELRVTPLEIVHDLLEAARNKVQDRLAELEM